MSFSNTGIFLRIDPIVSVGQNLWLPRMGYLLQARNVSEQYLRRLALLLVIVTRRRLERLLTTCMNQSSHIATGCSSLTHRLVESPEFLDVLWLLARGYICWTQSLRPER